MISAPQMNHLILAVGADIPSVLDPGALGHRGSSQGTHQCCSFALESGIASKSLENWEGASPLGLAEEVKLLPGHP